MAEARSVVTGALSLAAVVSVVFVVQQPLPEFAVIDAALRGGNADAVGDALFTDHLLSFHLVGVLLLVGIVGAVALVQQVVPAGRKEQPAVADVPDDAPDLVGAAGEGS